MRVVTGVGRSSVVAATRVYAFLADNVNDIFHLETLSVTETRKGVRLVNLVYDLKLINKTYALLTIELSTVLLNVFNAQ